MKFDDYCRGTPLHVILYEIEDAMISENLPKNFHQNGRSVADDILKCTLKIQLFDMAIVSHYSVLHTLCIHYAFDDIYPY